MADILNNMGIIYDNTGAFDKALDCFDRVLKLDKKNNHQIGVAIALENIGVIYEEMGDTSKTYEYYNKALEIKKRTGNIATKIRTGTGTTEK